MRRRPTRRDLAAWKADKAHRIAIIIIKLAPRMVESVARREPPAARLAMAAQGKLEADLINAEVPPWLERGRVIARWKG